MKHLYTLLLFAGFSSFCFGQVPCDTLLVASFTPQHGEGNSYVFHNTSSSDSPLHTVYYWSFGDGATQSDHTGTHTYAEAGSYVVCLYAVLEDCTDTMCQELQVLGDGGPDCNAQFQFSSSPQHADSVQFNPGQANANH
ncbi:MAG: PKD domain-containing protein, partial [Flavobacteriales bacterium]